MNTLMSILFVIINNTFEKNINYHIALEILSSIQEINTMSVTKLALLANTSTNSINKFCKMLGYMNFSELKVALNGNMGTRKTQLAHRIHRNNEQEIIQLIGSLTKAPFDQEMFIQQSSNLLEQIHTAHRVILTGASYPLALALHMQEDFLMMNKLIIVEQNTQQPKIPNLQENDLVIIISNTGRIFNFLKLYIHNYQQLSLDTFFICGHNSNNEELKNLLEMPINDEVEMNNVILYEIFNYLKYRYYMEYYKKGRC